MTDLCSGDAKASRDLVIALAEAAAAGDIDDGALANSIAANAAATSIQLL